MRAALSACWHRTRTHTHANVKCASVGLLTTTRCAASRAAHSPPAASKTSITPHARAFNEHEGIFQNRHLNNFPVRAAIDIGTGGVVSLCIARVDAAHDSIVKVMYQTQLPLFLEAQSPPSTFSASASAPPFLISEKSLTDIKNKMRVLHGAMRRDAYEGLSERAAVLSWPLCDAANAAELAAELTRELKIDVRVLGRTFNVAWPFADTPRTQPSEGKTTAHTGDAVDAGGSRTGPSSGTHHGASRQMSLKALVREAKRKRLARDQGRQRSCHTRADQAADDDAANANATHDEASVSANVQVAHLAFLAHAAMAQCVAPQRMVAIVEDPQKGVVLVGTDTSEQMEVADLLQGATSSDDVKAIRAKLTTAAASSTWFSTDEKVPTVPTRDVALVEHRLPIDVAEAHRLCVTRVQRRDPENYGVHTSSPNPLLAKEFDSLVSLMTPMLAETLPAWVRRKSALGGVIAGTSFNGGLLNLAARVAQKSHLSLDHLEVHARHHFCGLTDVLLASNFPNPLLVLPSAALACALMRALETPRVAYLPELTTACALLTQPHLWSYDRRASIRAEKAQARFYQSVQHRRFHRPHRKDHPTAAPGAVDSAHARVD